jgi:hypothetical protein
MHLLNELGRAKPARQSVQTQLNDHHSKIAMPSVGMAPAPTVRSRD